MLFSILGVLMGIFAALFNHTNKLLTQWRQKHVSTPVRRMFEALVVALATSVVTYVSSYSDTWCIDIDKLNLGQHATSYLSSFNCPDGQYNELSRIYLGRGYELVGNTEKALENYRHVLKLNPENEEAAGKVAELGG